jgi:putative transposase
MHYKLYRLAVHSILTTLDYQPLIDKITGNLIRLEIYERCKAMNIQIYHLEFATDHVHIIHELNPRIPITDLQQNLKGGTSHFVNSQKCTSIRFAWNKGPLCFSLGPGPEVQNAIIALNNHSEFHENISIQQEIAELRKAYPEIKSIEYTIPE